jgi:hypothetical protein
MFNPLIASVICAAQCVVLASLIVRFLDSRFGTKPSSVREKQPVLLGGIADARIWERASSRFVPREEILQARPACKQIESKRAILQPDAALRPVGKIARRSAIT